MMFEKLLRIFIRFVGLTVEEGSGLGRDIREVTDVQLRYLTTIVFL